MASDKQFQRIVATLQRTMDLPLTQSQRGTLKELCEEIAGGSNEQGATVPSFRLKGEADAKEQRWRVLRRRSNESRNWRISWRRLSHGGVGGVVENLL
jgi:hypothetical protein